MPTTLPRRLIGYGAYNLCFDNQLGRAANDPNGPDFFHALRQRVPAANLVKVIVYRHSGIEGLSAFPARRVPLYTPQREISEAFLSNLRNLIDTAAAMQPQFFVQVCIFSYQSVASLTGDNGEPLFIPREQPENIPFELVPPLPPPPTPPNSIDNARWFFNPSLNARSHKQKEMIAQLGQKLSGCTNVIWELVNELRISNDTGHEDDNRNTITWLGQMRDALQANAGQDLNLTFSTGVNNESQLMRGVPVTVFDFHGGQWSTNGHWQTGIPNAKGRALGYNASAPLIINDDGIDMPRNRPNVTGWARLAFQQGLHYSTKATYPPAKDFSAQQVAALNDANSSVP
ncbi:MAG TPA: hypothetical protein VGN90_13260 [Pyrinomonadaceae bacterium]|jgi:hypothetical protein|nr:hypothetical protein [Pyrinomonadaceae bacterium]